MQVLPSTDVLIIGGSHAGLAAALTLYRQNHTCIIFDSGEPRNRWATKTHALPTWEGRDPRDIREQARQELKATGLVRFVDTEISNIERRSDSDFRVSDSTGNSWVGRKLLLAIGKKHLFPDIPGYEDSFSTGIFHCLFTFGYEQRGKARGGLIACDMLASPMHCAIVIGDMRKLVDKISVYTNGELSRTPELEEVLKKENVTVNDSRIVGLEKGAAGGSQMLLRLADGTNITEDFLVHQPRTALNEDLVVKQLGLRLDERGEIAASPPFYYTSLPGVSAAGDCAAPFKIISNAMFMGANAGVGLARQLTQVETCTPSERDSKFNVNESVALGLQSGRARVDAQLVK